MLDPREPACRFGGEKADSVVGEVRVEGCDERVGLGSLEIADQAGEPNVGLSYDKSCRLGTKPVCAIRVETGCTREPRRDRPVLLLRDAAIAAGGRDQAVLFDGGRRRGGEQTR